MTINIVIICLTITSSWVYKGEGRINGPVGGGAPPPGVFDITKYEAVGDGSDDTNDEGESANAIAFIQAWRAACDGMGVTRVLIPPGRFVTGPVLFRGPCKAKVTVELQGTVLANPDITLYSEPHVLMFENVDGVTLMGQGIVDGQGPKNWKINDCSKSSNCAPLPTSIKFHRANNSVVEGVKSIDPMFFHMFVSNCHNITIRNVNITAPFNSPNTDGIHIGSSDLITIADSIIGTGDDCISIGHGSRDITVIGNNLSLNDVCMFDGEYDSVGSLGKYKDELEVVGVLVKNCTLTGTTNGARIKSWPGNKPNKASAITYEDLVMDHVKNPIIIDQQYGKESSTEASQVKVSDVHFRNIRGTSATSELVTFACSSALPCEGIEVADVSLTFDGKAAIHKKPSLAGVAGDLGNLVTTCLNAKVAFMEAWHKACNCSTGPSKVIIPKGNFVVAEVIFAGPCKNHVTVELQGSMIADPDVSQFPNHEFIVFQNVDGVTFHGFGSIDATNQVPNQKTNIHDVKFNDAKKTEATKTKSNGIYISASSLVNVSNSNIKTGDDCITITPGSTSVSITGLTCESGQGISIGSQALTAELDIKGVLVKNILFKGSAFGARIIPRVEAKASIVSDIRLEDLVMDGVQSPIVINQNSLKLDAQIQAKITNVQINNIKGTTTTRDALSFLCSPELPCDGIQVGDIDLSFINAALPRKVDIDLSIVGKTINGKGLNSL
ncbi:hypothetical protein RDABS01_006080, partial [Bienertia sinuspersici]